MASLHRDSAGRSPFWYVALSDHTGRRHFISTRTANKAEARKVAVALTKAKELAGQETLSPDRARRLIHETVNDILESSPIGVPRQGLAAVLKNAAAIIEEGQASREHIQKFVGESVARIMQTTGQNLRNASIHDWCQRWLQIKSVESEPSTHSRYTLALDAFEDFLGPQAHKDLNTITTDTVLRFRDSCANRLAVGTVNTHLRILRACLNSAYKVDLVAANAAAKVGGLRERGESKRRALTLAEMQKVLEVCGDTPWRGLVLVGLYTGQRLSDCARLSWQQVDLLKEQVWFVTRKTGKRLEMKLARPLTDYLSALPSTDDPSAFLFPAFAAKAENTVSALSSAFAEEVLIPAGLMAARLPKSQSNGTGRSGKRQVNAVTFHSLRHSFVSMMKAAGSSNAMAQMIVGHESSAVSSRYTHLSAADTADSISKLPDVTAPQPDAK